MDLLRGFAILLVFFYHSITTSDATVNIPPLANAINAFLAPIRMPLLMVLSGLLVAPSMAKGRQRYLRGKVQRIGWPYLLWTVLMVAIWMVRTSESQSLTSLLKRILQLSYYPADHLWFLYYLLIFYSLAWLTRRAAWWLPPTVLFLVACLSQTADRDTLQRFAYLGVFFMLGVAASSEPAALARVSRLPIWMAMPATALSAAALAALMSRTDSLRFDVLTLPSVLIIAIGLCSIAQAIAPSKFLNPLKSIGSNSLAFYLIHYPVMVGVIALAQSAGVHWPYLLLLSVQLTAGLASGLALTMLARQRRFRWLLVWPGTKTPSSE